jgi:hypothetical protein
VSCEAAEVYFRRTPFRLLFFHFEKVRILQFFWPAFAILAKTQASTVFDGKGTITPHSGIRFGQLSAKYRYAYDTPGAGGRSLLRHFL